MSSSEDYRGQLLDVAWGQWAALGVFTSVPPSDDRAVDIEALTVFTLQLAPGHDPRQLGELLDWLVVNGDLVSLRRLRTMQRHGLGWTDPVEATIKWVSEHNRSLDWRARAPTGDNRNHSSAKTEWHGPRDPVFEEYGYRTAIERSGRSRQVDLVMPQAFGLRLRRLMGLGCHAEVARILACAAPMELTTDEIVRAAMYNKRNVVDVLDGLDDARLVVSRLRGRQRVYRTDPSRWEAMFALSTLPGYVNWAALFRLALRLLAFLEDPDRDKESTYLRGRHAMDFSQNLAAEIDDLDLQPQLGRIPDHADAEAWVDELVPRVVARLRGDPKVR
jgi:hypothetical protein